MLLIFLILGSITQTSSSKIKLVEAPFAFNNVAGGNANFGEGGNSPLISRYLPSQPSGPQFLIDNLYGKCFNYIANNYKYRFCPYQNITQREQSYRWSAFNGILGIWKHWLISNDTFVSMHMVHGDICSSSLDRQVKVTLACGVTEEIISVSEPSMCHYEMLFRTRFACPKDIFMVYPMLTNEGKASWQTIEEEYLLGDLTEKGYRKKRSELFLQEYLQVKELKERKSLTEIVSPTERLKDATKKDKDSVENNKLNECEKKYENAAKELEELRETLRKLVLKHGVNLFSTDEVKNNSSASNKEYSNQNFKASISPDEKSKIVSNADLSNESRNNADNFRRVAKQKGDSGTLSENENPNRLLQGRIKIEKKNHTHENERKLNL